MGPLAYDGKVWSVDAEAKNSGAPWWSWDPQPLADCNPLHSMKWAGSSPGVGRWVAVGGFWNGGTTVGMVHSILTSDDGDHWSGQGAVCGLDGVAHSGKSWMAVGARMFAKSGDGIHWQYDIMHNADGLPLGSRLFAVTGSQQRWVAVGGTPTSGKGAVEATSDDGGLDWTVQSIDTGTDPNSPADENDLFAVATNGTAWIAVGQTGVMLWSADTYHWTLVNSDATQRLRGIATDGHRWVAVGDGVITTSTDGHHWAAQPAKKFLSAVSTDSREWTAVADGGDVFSSSDGVTWTQQAGTGTLNLYGVASDGRARVAAGADGSMKASLDGASWEPVPSPGPHRADLVAVASSLEPLRCEVSSPSPSFANTPIRFTGTGGNSPYEWTGGGSPATGSADKFTTTWTSPGIAQVSVSDSSNPPFVAGCPAIAIVDPPLFCDPASVQVQLGASQSFTVSGGEGPYAWSGAGMPENGTGQGFTTQFVTARPGVHDVTVTDSQGTIAVCQVEVQASSANPPPSASARRAPSRSVSRPYDGPVTPTPKGASGQADQGDLPLQPNVGSVDRPPDSTQAALEGIAGPAVPSPLAIAYTMSRPMTFAFHSNRTDGAFGWDFGDGSPVSPLQEPTHAYSAPGAYGVCLRHIGFDGRLEGVCLPIIVNPTHTVSSKSIGAAPASPWPWGWAAVGATLLAVSSLLRYGWPNFVLAFFSRLRQSDLALHPVRAAVLDILASQPWLHTPALAERVGRSQNTVQYHLDLLLAAGLVQQRTWRSTRSYAVAPAPTPKVAPGVLRSPKAQALLERIQSDPGIAYMELIRDSGMRKSTVRHHLSRLQAAGLVAVRREGRRVRFFGKVSA